jgi:hypothetical protein
MFTPGSSIGRTQTNILSAKKAGELNTSRKLTKIAEINIKTTANNQTEEPNPKTKDRLLTSNNSQESSDTIKVGYKFEVKKHDSRLKNSNTNFNKRSKDISLSHHKLGLSEEIGTNFFKTKEIEFLYYQYLFNSFFQCLFCLTSIVCAVIQYEWEYSSGSIENEEIQSKSSESIIYVTNCFCFITSIFLWITYAYEHFINCRIFFLRKNLPERIWRKKSDQIIELLIKLLINLLHPTPFFIGIDVEIFNEKYNYKAVHSINSIMTVFCLIRLWCFFKFYLIYSDYFSPRSQRICQMNNFETSLNFSMKANMSKAPQNAYLILFLIILGFCSYSLRIFERVLDEVSGQNFSSFWNTIWSLIITMTTVGYGDYFPSSFLGRLIGIMACTCGIFLISMLIVTISNLLELTPIEENVFKIIRRIKLTQEKDEIASKFVTKYLKYMVEAKKNKLDVSKTINDDLLLGIHNLKEKIKEIDDTFPHYGENDILKDQLTRIEETVDETKEFYDSIENQVREIKEILRGLTLKENF